MGTQSMIVAEGLSKSFGETEAVCGVDLVVPEATVLGLLGPNGSGKTTIVRMLTTALRPDGGQARVAGNDVVREAKAVRRMIGLAGQYAAVDENLTGRENIEMVARLYHLSRRDAQTRANELLERFDLVAHDAADRSAKTYSGGMRRRLDVAASLTAKPRVLFLDEPTTGLDPRSRQTLWDVTKELVENGTTVLLTTQYLEEADHLANQIVVLNTGRVVAAGTAADLKRRIGSSVLVLTLHNEADASNTASMLGRLSGCDVEIAGRQVSVPILGGPALITRSLRVLDDARISLSGLAVHEPTLDDVFLSLTSSVVDPSTDSNGTRQ